MGFAFAWPGPPRVCGPTPELFPTRRKKITLFWNGICKSGVSTLNDQTKPQPYMTIYRKALAAMILLTAGLAAGPASCQMGHPGTAPTTDRDSATEMMAGSEAPLTLHASLGARTLAVLSGGNSIRSYLVAIGNPKYPTPRGTYKISKIVWNPSWRPPPGAAWAKGKTPKGPGDPNNPMKVVKIFFREPDYYIHGTDDVESLGSAESHGCLRMEPGAVADLAKMVMEQGGQPRGENWFWRIIHFRSEEKVVYLDQPISLTITD
jgi:lipoprotein-anchoring transpeptidase ErfK/SrfK